MADIKIDEAKAIVWIKEVKEEINSVERTLLDVREVCDTQPGEDDSIFQMIETTGKFLEDSWTTTNSVFKKAWNSLEEGLGNFKNAGEKIQDAFDELKAKI